MLFGIDLAVGAGVLLMSVLLLPSTAFVFLLALYYSDREYEGVPSNDAPRPVRRPPSSRPLRSASSAS